MSHTFWRTTYRDNEQMEMEVSDDAFYAKLKEAQDTFKKYIKFDPNADYINDTDNQIIAEFGVAPDRYIIPESVNIDIHEAAKYSGIAIHGFQKQLEDDIQMNYGHTALVSNDDKLLLRMLGPIPTFIGTDVPTTYEEMQEIYYGTQIEQLIDSARDLEYINRDVLEWKENLRNLLRSEQFWTKFIDRDDDEDSFDVNQYHIDNDIDAAIAGAKIDTSSLTLRILSNIKKKFTLKKTTAQLAIVDDSIPYSDFPLNVRSFMVKRFADVLSDELNQELEKTSVSFMRRPEKYTKDIAGELLPGNVIAYYLPKETISKNWYGVVHELTHIVQSCLKGSVLGIPNSPNIKAVGYVSGGEVYRQDPGEIHAYATADEYLLYDKTRGGEPLIDDEFDDIKSQNFDMFSKRFELYGDDGPNIFWSGEDVQNARFDAMLSIADFNGKTVLDVGCGFGDFANHCKNKGIKLAGYKGVDIVEGIIEVAKKQNPEYEFEARDLMKDPLGKDTADIVIASGIFALSHRNYNDYVIEMMSVMQYHAKELTIANFLKQNPEANDKGLKYHEPEEMQHLIQYRVTESAQLKDDYLYDDFIVFIQEVNND